MIGIWMPELTVAFGAMLVLLLSIWHQRYLYLIVMAVLSLASIALLNSDMPSRIDWAVDSLSVGGKLVLLIATLVLIPVIQERMQQQAMPVGAIYTLLMLAVLGGMVTVSANDFLLMFLGIELVAVPSYILCSMVAYSPHADEAGLKYFVMGSISSVFFVYGVSLVYGATGLFNFNAIALGTNTSPLLFAIGAMFVLGAFIFKMGLFPFHYWVPDVYEASPMALSYWVITVPKWVYLVALLRLSPILLSVPAIPTLLWLTGVSSLVFGAMMACAQSNVRRMLGYASIAQMGMVFLLLGLATQSAAVIAIMYMLAYIASLIVAWHILVKSSDVGDFNLTMSSLSGWAAKQPVFATVFAIVMASMAGIPLTVGFVAKLGALYALVEAQLYSTLTLVLLSLVLAVYYYMQVIRSLFFDLSPLSYQAGANRYTLVGGIFIIVSGLMAMPVYQLCAGLITGVFR